MDAPECEYDPTEQPKQFEVPELTSNMPAAHDEHALAPVAEYMPELHAEQLDDPVLP